MSEESALAAIQAIFPEDTPYLSTQRERTVGPDGVKNNYYIFNHDTDRDSCIVAHSTRSWEHCLAIAKSGNPDCWPEEDAPMEEVSNA